jgi:hypothetical protein
VSVGFVEAAHFLGGQPFGPPKTNPRHGFVMAGDELTASNRYRDMFLWKGSREVTR